MQDFTKLRVWEASVRLAEHLYRVTSEFPAAERYGLTAQIRSAAVSVSSNIAEGSGRRGGADTSRFLQMAIGSICEIDSQVRVANRLGMLPNPEGVLVEVDRVRRQLIRLKDRVDRGGPATT